MLNRLGRVHDGFFQHPWVAVDGVLDHEWETPSADLGQMPDERADVFRPEHESLNIFGLNDTRKIWRLYGFSVLQYPARSRLTNQSP